MRTLLGSLLLSACVGLSACPAPPLCAQDADCEDQNPCTLDSCSEGVCFNVPDDGAVPPQGALDDCLRQACSQGQVQDLPSDGEVPPAGPADDCVREACQGGAVVLLTADNETPTQVGAACLLELCQGGEVVSEPAPPGAGGCQDAEFCDVDAGCQPSFRDLAQAPGSATLFGDQAFSHLTDFQGLAAGDFDGDGQVDIAASMPDKSVDAGDGLRAGAGEVRVVSGPFSGEVDLANAPSISLFGAAAGDRTGLTLASCDFDGDGQADLLISAPNAAPNGLTGAGALFGVLGPLTADRDLSGAAAAGPELVIQGNQPGVFAPDRILCEDLNGDGADDVVLGAENHEAGSLPGGGVVMIFLGGATLTGTVGFSQADITVQGHSSDMHLGGALAVGDFDNDAKPDLAVGAPRIGQNQARPETVILLKNPSLFDAQGDPVSSAVGLGQDAVFIDGGNRGQFGFDFAAADFDGDGVDDLAIGAILADPQGRADAGEVSVVYGQPDLQSFAIDGAQAQITSVLGFESGDETGIALAAGDHNGDGFLDLLIGAHQADGFGNNAPGLGEAFLFLGGASLAAGQTLDLTIFLPALVIFGRDGGGNMGKHLQIVDMDGNGKGDLLLTAPFGLGPSGSGRTEAGNVSLLLAP